MSFPAHEIIWWEEYFKIVPFSQDRADARAALIAQTIANMSGQVLKHPLDINRFIPNYFEDDTVATEASLEEQTKRAMAFREKYKV